MAAEPSSPPSDAQRKDGYPRPDGATSHSGPAHRKKEARRRIFRELVHIAADQGATIRLGVSTADALQECLDRAVGYMRFAADKVDSLLVDDLEQGEDDGFFVTRTNAQGGVTVEPNRWYSMEREARIEVERLAAMMTQLGIAERVVRVREAEAALVVAAVREAAIEAGIPHDQVRALGAALRHRVENPDAPLRSKTPSYGNAATADATIKASREIEGSLADLPG